MIFILVMLIAPAAAAPEPTPVETAWSVLKDGAENKNPYKRAAAAHALGLLPQNAKAEAMAETALTDSNVEVRVQGANALGQMGASSARSKLKEALKDKEVKVVIAAANSLYLLKDPAGYEVYYALLTGKEKSSQGLVQSQLAVLKDRKALEKLIFETGIGFVPFGGAGYQAWKTVTHDDTSPVLAIAAEKLANDPDPKSGEALGDACSDRKWRVRAAAADALAKRGNPAFMDALIPLLTDENDTARCEGAAALLHLTAVRPTVRKRVRRK